MAVGCIAPPPGQCSTTLRGVPYAYSSANEKRAQGDVQAPSIVGCFVGAPTLVLPHGDLSETEKAGRDF